MRSVLILCCMACCSTLAFSEVNDGDSSTTATSQSCQQLEKRLDSLAVQVTELKMERQPPVPLKWGTGAFQQVTLSAVGVGYRVGFLSERRKPDGTYRTLGPVFGFSLPFIDYDSVSAPVDIEVGFVRGSPILANVVNFSIGASLVGRYDMYGEGNVDSDGRKGVGVKSDVMLNLWRSGNNSWSIGQQIGFVVNVSDGSVSDLSTSTCCWTHYFGKKPQRGGK